MNNNILAIKKGDLIKNSDAIAETIAKIDAEIQKLTSEKTQLLRNFDATSGALQLIEILMSAPDSEEEAPKLEVVE